jgi:ketosteroid isomerase-like protein
MDVDAFVKRVYDAWNRGETGSWSEYFADDAVYETSGLFPGFAPVYHGPDGMRRFYETMLEAWESFQIDVIEVTDLDQMTGTRIRFRAQGKASGVEVDLEFAHGFRIDDGKVAHLISKPSLDEVRARAAELAAEAPESSR